LLTGGGTGLLWDFLDMQGPKDLTSLSAVRRGVVPNDVWVRAANMLDSCTRASSHKIKMVTSTKNILDVHFPGFGNQLNRIRIHYRRALGSKTKRRGFRTYSIFFLRNQDRIALEEQATQMWERHEKRRVSKEQRRAVMLSNRSRKQSGQQQFQLMQQLRSDVRRHTTPPAYR